METEAKSDQLPCPICRNESRDLNPLCLTLGSLAQEVLRRCLGDHEGIRGRWNRMQQTDLGLHVPISIAEALLVSVSQNGLLRLSLRKGSAAKTKPTGLSNSGI